MYYVLGIALSSKRYALRASFGLAACSVAFAAGRPGTEGPRYVCQDAVCRRLADCIGAFASQRIARPTARPTFDPKKKRWSIQRDSWEADRVHGFPTVMELMVQLHARVKQPIITQSTRSAILRDLLYLLKKFPFLRYQFHSCASENTTVRDPSYASVPNDFFVQFMSRWVLLLLTKVLHDDLTPNEWQEIGRFAFPQTWDGQMACGILRQHHVLLLGIDVSPPNAPGAGSTAWFQDAQLEAIGGLLDMLPRQLIHGPTDRGFRSITAHSMEYIKQYAAYAKEFLPQYTRSRAGLGYLSGNDLNILAAPVGSPQSDAELAFLRNDARCGFYLARRASRFLVVLAHEITHRIHSTVARANPAVGGQLRRLIELGSKEAICIRDIDQDPQNFGGSKAPGWKWLKAHPQEFMATGANVVFVDPELVLQWAVSVARHEKKILPLNYFLCYLDIFSLDRKYATTNRSMLLSLQPNGTTFRRMSVLLKRDHRKRITAARWPGASLQVRYGKDNWATVKRFRADTPGSQPHLLVDCLHGACHTKLIRSLDGVEIVKSTGPLTSELLQSVGIVYIHYTGASISQKEARILRDFVGDGGGLFVLMLGWSLQAYKKIGPDENPLNKLCRPFGMRFNADYASGEQMVERPDLPWAKGYLYSARSMPRRNILSQVKSIYTWGRPSSISLSPPAFPIICCGGQEKDRAIVAGSQYGKGRVVGMQPSGFYHPSLWRESAAVDNCKLVTDIFTWLRGSRCHRPSE